MAFSSPFFINLFYKYKLPPIQGQIVGLNHQQSDGTLFVDCEWSYERLLEQVSYVLGVDSSSVHSKMTFVWADLDGARKHIVISNQHNLVALYMYAFRAPELYIGLRGSSNEGGSVVH